MKKMGIIIQARMTSTRLPGKVLMPIFDSNFLKIQIDRLLTLKLPLIIATTTNQTDDSLVNFALNNNLIYYRGSEDNVLSRYYYAAIENSLTDIIRITSDCPLIDAQLIQIGINKYLELNDTNLFVSNTIDRTYPRGFDFEIFSFDALTIAFKNAHSLEDLEHVTPYLWKNKNGNTKLIQIKNDVDNSNLRLTLDTFEDYQLLKLLIENYKANNLSGNSIINLLDQNPELVFINQHIEQKKLNENGHYKPLHTQVFEKNQYKLCPIRHQDKDLIRKWRNEQIDILRQEKLLTDEEQNLYFDTVIKDLFEQEYPKQLLFGFFENNCFIGYGGLVHIDWENKTAEISFLTETSRNIDTKQVIADWENYLQLIKKMADIELNFNSIYTFAYDIRPHLYLALSQSGFIEEERKKDFIVINHQKIDALIHRFYFKPLISKMASINDSDLYFKWANDKDVRFFSYNQNEIKAENHTQWFNEKLKDENYYFYLFLNSENQPVGQVRIVKENNETLIGISVDEHHRGHNYAAKMIALASKHFIKENPLFTIQACIKINNKASKISFEKAGYLFDKTTTIQNIESDVLTYKKR